MKSKLALKEELERYRVFDYAHEYNLMLRLIQDDLLEHIKELENDLSYAPNTRVGFQIIREMIENND